MTSRVVTYHTPHQHDLGPQKSPLQLTPSGMSMAKSRSCSAPTTLISVETRALTGVEGETLKNSRPVHSAGYVDLIVSQGNLSLSSPCSGESEDAFGGDPNRRDPDRGSKPDAQEVVQSIR